MRYATLHRYKSTDAGTFGEFFTPEGFWAVSGEQPDRNNQPRQSCIITGTYLVKWWLSPTKGPCYKIQDVPNRKYILIHSANWMGDTQKGYRSQLKGCIALGRTQGVLNGQTALLESRDTTKAFANHMNRQPFILTITNRYREEKPPPEPTPSNIKTVAPEK